MWQTSLIASRHTSFADCRAPDANHVWDDGTVRGDGTPDVVGEWLCGSRARFNAALPEHRRLSSGRRPDGAPGDERKSRAREIPEAAGRILLLRTP